MTPPEPGDRVFHPDLMLKIVSGVMTAAIVAGVGILWNINLKFAGMAVEVTSINARLQRLENAERDGTKDRYTSQQATADLTLIRADIARNRDRTDALDGRIDALSLDVAKISIRQP